MKRISKYISYQESVTSQTATRNGIDNTPSDSELISMQLVGIRVFDEVREHFDTPIRVSSFFRALDLNRAVGSKDSSQHRKGQAIDMQGTGKVSNKMIFNYIKDNLDYDQLIWEYGNKTNPAWVHVSYVSREKNRKQIIYVGVK